MKINPLRTVRKIISIIRNSFYSPRERAEKLKNEGFSIGLNCEIFSNVSFGSEPYLINMGDNVKVTDGCRFITHDGGMYVLRNLNLLPNSDKFGKIIIDNNVFIGMNSIILPGVHVGTNCVIGAGSIVTRDLPPNTVVAGVPAKVINTIEQYYLKNKDNVELTKTLSAKEKRDFLIKRFGL